MVITDGLIEFIFTCLHIFVTNGVHGLLNFKESGVLNYFLLYRK